MLCDAGLAAVEGVAKAVTANESNGVTATDCCQPLSCFMGMIPQQIKGMLYSKTPKKALTSDKMLNPTL
jgi:hypothetical protein